MTTNLDKAEDARQFLHGERKAKFPITNRYNHDILKSR